MIKAKINSYKKEYTSSEKEIAKYILNNFNESTAKLSITMLSQKIHVSPAALTRFCQKNQMTGFKEFQYLMLEEIENSKNSSNSKDVDEIISTLKRTDSSLDMESIKLIAKTIWKTQNVYVYGEAFTHIMAQTLSRKLNKINIPSTVYNVASDVGVILPKGNSVHIFISTSGQNPNVKYSVQKICAEPAKKQMIVSIVAGNYSNIEDYSNVIINGNFEGVSVNNTHELPTVSFHVIQYITDVIYKLVYKMNKDKNDNIITNLSRERKK